MCITAAVRQRHGTGEMALARRMSPGGLWDFTGLVMDTGDVMTMHIGVVFVIGKIHTVHIDSYWVKIVDVTLHDTNERS